MSYDAIRDLLSDVLDREKDAFSIYEQIVEKVESDEIKTVISAIMKDEVRHISNAEQMLKILDQ